MAAGSKIFKNGIIYTVKQDNPWAQAIAISGETILAVGSNEEIDMYRGPGTQEYDLESRLVLPSFIDAHSHPSHGVDLLHNISLYNLGSVEKYTQSIQDFIARYPERDFYRGSGWDNSLFSLQGPEKEILDQLSGDKPAALVSYDGHSLWVNSATLSKAGITKDTPHPEGGVIEKHPQSAEPLGTLRETAMKLVEGVLPGHTLADLVKTLQTYQEMSFECGVTMTHDAMLDQAGIAAFKQLENEDQLRMNFRGSIHVEPDQPLDQQIEFILDQRAHNRHAKFQTNTAKLFVDGVVEGGTAYLLEPYANNPDFYGDLIWEPGALNEVCAALDKEEIQIHIHVIGDGAARIALDALEFAQLNNGKRDARHMITHLQLVAPQDILRFKQLGVIALPNPYWFKIDKYYHKLALPYLGEDRARQQYPMHSFLDCGVRLASASDFPVTVPYDPLIGIELGVTRAPRGTVTGEILWPEERLNLAEMVASFTINGAYANFLEQRTGSLEAGKQADFIILDRNIFNLPPEAIATANVIQTYLDGQEVFNLEGKV